MSIFLGAAVGADETSVLEVGSFPFKLVLLPCVGTVVLIEPEDIDVKFCVLALSGS